MKKWLVVLTLNAPSGYHIGGWASGTPAVDASVARDARARLVWPGSSIAGPLRAEAMRLAPALFGKKGECSRLESPGSTCECVVCKLFGTWNPRHPGEHERGDGAAPGATPDDAGGASGNSAGAANAQAQVKAHASRLIVNHAIPVDAVDATVVDRVAIGRSTGAAAARRKFDHEVAGQAAVYEVVLEVDGPSDKDRVLLDTLIGEIDAGRVAFGAGSGGGLGWIEGRCEQALELDLNDDVVLAAYLDHDVRDRDERGALAVLLQQHAIGASASPAPDRQPQGSGSPPTFLDVGFRLEFPEYELVNDPALAALAGTHGTHVTDAGGQRVVRGWSMRGPLRARCEYILRRATRNAARPAACDPFDDRADSPLRSCASRIRAEYAGMEKSDDAGARLLGVVQANTCLACTVFGHEYRGSTLKIGNLATVLKVKEEEQHLDFIAVDRFTGGVVTGAKYDVCARFGVQYDGRVLIRDYGDWWVGLLLLGLRDLFEGELRLGASKTRGFGRARGGITRWVEGVVGAQAQPGGKPGKSGAFVTGAWEADLTEGAWPRSFPMDATGLTKRFVDPLKEEIERWHKDHAPSH